MVSDIDRRVLIPSPRAFSSPAVYVECLIRCEKKEFGGFRSRPCSQTGAGPNKEEAGRRHTGQQESRWSRGVDVAAPARRAVLRWHKRAGLRAQLSSGPGTGPGRSTDNK